MSEERSEAFKNGYRAHKLECDVNDNPYNDKTEAYSNSEWCSGWCYRFGAVKHDQLNDEDEAL